LAGIDFFTVEVLTWRGLVTYYVLFFIHLESRRVSLAGITRHPDQAWMLQMARNATGETWGFLEQRRYALHDRDTKFCSVFRATLAAGGIKPIQLPARSTNLNAYAERWVRSAKEECLSKLILFGAASLRRALTAFKETTKARTTLCSSLPLLRLCPVGDLASTVESASAAYLGITVAPHEYFDQTGLSLTSWNYIGHDPEQFRHYGPVAQEFFAAFGHDGVGTVGTPTTLNSGDAEGILMIAVQLESGKRRIQAENAELKARIEALERLVEKSLK
jgi:hypothetical protein